MLSVGLGAPEDVPEGEFSVVVEFTAGGRSGLAASATTGGRSTVVELAAAVGVGSTVVEVVAGGRSVDVEVESVIVVVVGVIIVLLPAFGSGNVAVPFFDPSGDP